MRNSLIVTPTGWRTVALAEDILHGGRIFVDTKNYIAQRFATNGAIYWVLINHAEPVTTQWIQRAITESGIQPTIE